MVCNVCKNDLDVSNFYYRNDTKKYRLNCKKCKPLNNKEVVANRTSKICKHCNIEKPLSEFQKVGRGKWLQPYCKPCDSERKKEWGNNNKEVLKDKYKKYYTDRVKPFVIKKERILVSKEWKMERNKKYRSTPEYKAKKYLLDKKYREKNKEKVAVMKKQYYALKGNEMAKAWQKKNMNNIEFRTKKRLRGRIYVALKRGIKSESTMKLLGCSIDYFKKYFESLFTDGMNWNVYLKGGIHIDHIIPCKNFDLTNSEEQHKCFHYSNLQPLWELDNLRKGVSIKSGLWKQ